MFCNFNLLLFFFLIEFICSSFTSHPALSLFFSGLVAVLRCEKHEEMGYYLFASLRVTHTVAKAQRGKCNIVLSDFFLPLDRNALL